MRTSLVCTIILVFLWPLLVDAGAAPQDLPGPEPGKVAYRSGGLHGYIGFRTARPPAEYSAGMGFYTAVWPLINQPLADFQIGLAGCWILPDNSDNKDTPLCPEGTLARRWSARGPTWESVFQTVEGGVGYWAGNHFRYGPPKFSMNATPQCYDYEIGSPGWSFFYSSKALPDDRLGIAQLSNRLLIPPDGLTFQGNPNGEFLGYTWMALPFTEPTTDDPPTGDQSWTCFLSAANFKGPIAYYIPETWSKIGKLFKCQFLYGRGLDARPGKMNGGAMEINTVPRFDAQDAQGVFYSKIPTLQFPVDEQGRSFLVQEVTYYSKAALYDAFKAWRDGGAACSGQFDQKAAWKPELTTHTPQLRVAGKIMDSVERFFRTKVFEGNIWGMEWQHSDISPKGVFPRYFKWDGEKAVAVPAAEVPTETRLPEQQFKLAGPGEPYTSPEAGAWTRPGPTRGPFTVRLADGSLVTYYWYRFVDQPSFQQYQWSEAKKAKLQALVEKIHASWPIDRDYMPPLKQGKLVSLDPALLVTPPKGLEAGYVPIVTRQEHSAGQGATLDDEKGLLGGMEKQPGLKKVKPVKVLNSWSGKIADETLRKYAPGDLLVLDEQQWEKLWKAWRGPEKLPQIDFRKELILVFTAGGPNNVGCRPMVDSEGNLQAGAMSTLIAGPGFGYLIQCIPREGIRSVNGKPLPEQKPPAKKPRPKTPGAEPGVGPSGEPGVVPGSPGAAPYPGDASGEQVQLPPLKQLDNLVPSRSVFKGANWRAPLVLRSPEEAARHFPAEELAKLGKQVDFSKQFVLLFAWLGSGQDRLDAAVAESYPEQVYFRLVPGRTRDLREHVRIFALRADVKWSVASGQ